MSIRKAAKSHHVPKSTLQRRLAGKVEELSPASRPPVFNREQESELVGHILDMEARGFGLTIQDICKLSFDLAEQLTLKHMFNTNKRKAGYDWYEGFMKRHPQLAIRKPEGLSARSCKRKSTEQHKLKCNDKAVDDPENYCTYCNGYYFDDDSDDEDWVKCKFEMCRSWYHESCTGAFGKSLSQFLCNKHST